MKFVVPFLLVACCLALETQPAEPVQSESGFAPLPMFSVPQLIAQEQIFRKIADAYLGLHIATQFQSLGYLEAQKFGAFAGAHTTPVFVEDTSDDESDSDESSDSEISLLELKSETGFVGAPFMQYGYGHMGSSQNGAKSTMTKADLEHQGSYAKMSALKAMQLQFYLAAGDVEKSYWVNRLIALVFPPQITVFKLYKSYLNTMALSIAYQFHDTFTFEAFMDDFNDQYGDLTGKSSALTEALAEQNLYSSWQQLAMIKWYMVLLTMYENAMFSMYTQPAAATQPAFAQSYLEESSEFTGAAGSEGYVAYMHYYMQIYQFMLRYYSITVEMQLAQSGLMASSVKAMNLQSQGVSKDMNEMATSIEGNLLPMLYIQFGSVNQMKYYLVWYEVMLDMYAPQLAVMQSSQRAENVFQNLVQTDAPVLTPTEEVKAETAQSSTQ